MPPHRWLWTPQNDAQVYCLPQQSPQTPLLCRCLNSSVMPVMLEQQQLDSVFQELDLAKQQMETFCARAASGALVPAEVHGAVLEQLKLVVNELEMCVDQLQRQQDQVQTLLAQNQALEQINQALRKEISAHQSMQAALQYQAQQERLLDLITHRIRKSLELDDILRTTVDEVRQFLQVDRVVIYRFKPDLSGVVTVESVTTPRYSILSSVIEDPCFRDIYVEKYKQGRIQAMDDIYAADINPCYVHLLEQYQVWANLVVPIAEGESLWGLLIASQCSGPRPWEATDIVLMGRLSGQIAIAIQQSQLYEQVQRLATIDELTQVANRRRFEAHYDKTWRQALRDQGPLTLMMGDIDFFKPYNDTYGHPAGDACLKQIAAVLSSVLKRPGDLVARYGGEEFIMVLPDTDLAGAQHIADEILAKVRDLGIKHRTSALGYVTLSIGCISLTPSPGRQPQNAIKAADNALYRAKNEGRNRAILFELVDPSGPFDPGN
ncbi:hypothetical protein C7271_03520 [filamentous cyanobacterium CCP5]|nr:hypothetical protein C7271_03520 [filamentous cyanobacterium CCP5]